MGMGALGIAGPAVTRPNAPVPAASGGSALKFLIPLIILAAVGYGCYRYIVGGIRPRGAAGNTIVEMDPNAPVSNEYMGSSRREQQRPAEEEAPVMTEEAAAPAEESSKQPSIK